MKQKDLCLVPFPFSDLKGSKVRPVVIISNNTFNNSSKDVIVCGVTSQKISRSICISNKNMVEGNLFSTSYIKPSSILKIQKELILKKIGVIDDSILALTKKEILKIL